MIFIKISLDLWYSARVVKLANMRDSKSRAARLVGSSPTSGTKRLSTDLKLMAYVIGLSIGDGNLSNSNNRATRLRITCDLGYPNLIKTIRESLQKLLPDNKVSVARRKAKALDVYCYSNHLESILGWKAKNGSKFMQNVRVPDWIKENRNYSVECLRGLFQTDGSIYYDRGYKMVNFTTIIKDLANDVMIMVQNLDFVPKIYKISVTKTPKYIIRISRMTEDFITLINLVKD